MRELVRVLVLWMMAIACGAGIAVALLMLVVTFTTSEHELAMCKQIIYADGPGGGSKWESELFPCSWLPDDPRLDDVPGRTIYSVLEPVGQ